MGELNESPRCKQRGAEFATLQSSGVFGSRGIYAMDPTNPQRVTYEEREVNAEGRIASTLLLMQHDELRAPARHITEEIKV